MPTQNQTLYLLSFSAGDLKDRKPSAIHAYNAALSSMAIPSSAQKLPTIQCSRWAIPPPGICAWYSGVSESVQSFVVQDPTARHTIDTTISTIHRAFRSGKRAVYLKTCCGSGTHRSVACAEMIGQHFRRLGYGVVIRHPHRGRMVGDRR